MASTKPDCDHELLVAAARAVLASLREPLQKRSLPRAAIGALGLLETALDTDRTARSPTP
ncbi:hypothetical protein [Allosphingosinicella sp.]|jgi:hypothetical protein|uniref:hypothetical protein n=1 Tax=Allosphingosinicella sp. TaxID=2823234 RepID=UPI002F07472A